jgi:hypothetical protein
VGSRGGGGQQQEKELQAAPHCLKSTPDIAGAVASLTEGRTGRAEMKHSRETTLLR